MLRMARMVGVGYLGLCLVLLASLLLGGPSSYAPLSLARLTMGEPITVTLLASAEQQHWLEAALDSFAASSPQLGRRPIEVQLQLTSSGRLAEGLLAGELQPTAISPASSLELRMLEQRWSTQHGSALLAGGDLSPQSIVSTPLVVVAWENIGHPLWGNGSEQIWRDLVDSVTEQPNRRFLKLGHARPSTSSSGLMSMLLLTYEHYGYPPSQPISLADIENPSFQQVLREFERDVSHLSDSTESLIRQMVTVGPSQYEAVISYENLAMEYADARTSQWGELHVYYPPANLLADHPFAILQTDWVSPEQRQAAAQLRDYLLGAEAQTLALQHGLRPTSQALSIEAPDSPFMRYADYGVRTTLGALAVDPAPEVAQALRDLWSSTIRR